MVVLKAAEDGYFLPLKKKKKKKEYTSDPKCKNGILVCFKDQNIVYHCLLNLAD